MDLAEQLKIPVLVLLQSLYNIIELQLLENASGPLIRLHNFLYSLC